MTDTGFADAMLQAVRQADVMVADCPSRVILQHATSRWGVLVLVALQDGTLRFSALRRRIGGVSERMLAQTLQQLEHDGMVLRVAHAVVPPHVDYSLTPFGHDAARHVLALVRLIEGNLPQLIAARAAAGPAAGQAA